MSKIDVEVSQTLLDFQENWDNSDLDACDENLERLHLLLSLSKLGPVSMRKLINLINAEEASTFMPQGRK